MTPRCQPSPATTRTERAPTSGSVWTIFFAAARISASSSCRRTFSPSSCSASCAHLVGHRLVGGEQQPRGDVGRAHAAGGVDARRQHEARCDSCRSSCPSGPQTSSSARSPTLCGPSRQQVEPELRDHAVLADERHDVGQRADGGDLDEARQPALVLRRAGTAPAPASARRRRRPGTCPDSVQSWRFGLITASAGGSSVSGSW